MRPRQSKSTVRCSSRLWVTLSGPRTNATTCSCRPLARRRRRQCAPTRPLAPATMAVRPDMMLQTDCRRESGMRTVETILTLLVLTTALAFLARKANVPYPIFLVLGGMGLGFVPSLPAVMLDPQLVFLLFLPPILYAAGYFTSWRDFRMNLFSITLLAVGLVIATMTAVAAAVHALVPGIAWPVGLVLGAIVSPPDAVAATAIAQRLRLPRQIVTILEGESLVNDATGLVLLKFATAAVVTGSFSIASGVLEFLALVAGGLAVGFAMGHLFVFVQRFLDDPILATTASILGSFLVYIVAERLHVSGVLAVVVAGLLQGRYVPHIWSSATRIEGAAVWQTLVFLLNALVFVLIGLQLPMILRGLDRPWPTVVDGVFAAFGAMVLVRLLWMFPGAYLPRFLSARFRKTHPYPPWQAVTIVGWAGMRGVVSLAAARAGGRKPVSGAQLSRLPHVFGHPGLARDPRPHAAAPHPLAARRGGPDRRARRAPRSCRARRGCDRASRRKAGHGRASRAPGSSREAGVPAEDPLAEGTRRRGAGVRARHDGRHEDAAPRGPRRPARSASHAPEGGGHRRRRAAADPVRPGPRGDGFKMKLALICLSDML